MRDNSSVELKVDKLSAYRPDELEHIILNIQGTLTITVPCMFIGSTQSYRDVATDLLNALFIGESVAEFRKDVAFYERNNEHGNSKVIKFILDPQDREKLAKRLWEVSHIFGESETEEEEEIQMEVSDFQDKLGLREKKDYHFPSLIDDYFVNYIIGLGEDSDIPEDISEIDKEDSVQLQLYVHEKYGYIQSMYQGYLQNDLYLSTKDAIWIILSTSDIEITELTRLFQTYRPHILKPLDLQEASIVVASNFDTVVFNQVAATKYPLKKLIKAQECAAELYNMKSSDKVNMTNATKVKMNLLSSFSDILIVQDQIAQYVFFCDTLENFTQEALENFAKDSSALKAYLDNRETNLRRRSGGTFSYYDENIE